MDFLTVPVMVAMGLTVTAILFLLTRKPKAPALADVRDACMGYDMSFVRRRYMKEQQVSEAQALQAEREFKRWIILVTTHPKEKFGMPNGPIDEFWHTFLLYTEQYAAFCQTVAGRHIHHKPHDVFGDWRPGYRTFHDAYRRTFSCSPPVDWWPDPPPPPKPVTSTRSSSSSSKSSNQSSSSSSDSGYTPIFFAGSQDSGGTCSGNSSSDCGSSGDSGGGCGGGGCGGGCG